MCEFWFCEGEEERRAWGGGGVYFFCLYVYAQSLLCPTLCGSMDYSLPGSSVHGISQAKILEWVAISSSRGSSQQRDRTCISCISCIGRQILYYGTTMEAYVFCLLNLKELIKGILSFGCLHH